MLCARRQHAARSTRHRRSATSDIQHARTRHVAHGKRQVASSESSKEHATKAEQQATRKRAALEAKTRVPTRRSLIQTGQARGNPIHTTRTHGNPVKLSKPAEAQFKTHSNPWEPARVCANPDRTNSAHAGRLNPTDLNYPCLPRPNRLWQHRPLWSEVT